MSAIVAVPEMILRLIDKFQTHAESYHNGHYNETQLRREFLDPFFKALGWDVDNERGYAEAYKDVIHEDAIDVGGATKAPDYCYRIGGARKFFLEAKKPSIDIKGDPGPAYQLRRYAWSAKLPLSILSDFEEFAVYDCRVRPDPGDKASTARVQYFEYTDYADPAKWNQIASVFSREAVLKGSFDKYAESTRRKKGTAEVDEAFLKEIEDWRDALARNIALRNPKLSQRELNYAVGKTIDRIIFLRISEDRAVEPYGTLQALTAGPKIYPRLFERFQRADERYNSGLFHFSKERDRPETPDELTPGLDIDDKPLKDIIGRLYYPDSPYEFSVLSADILGQVYEQFLGKVIRLTAGHQAKVEEKPEVRKAGGVYYTPTYIVEYIVKNTVGKLVEGKTPQEIGGLTETWKPSRTRRPLAVLDPACGSGSFLLGAYQFLLDWYRDWYVNDGPKKHTAGNAPRLYQHSSGQWRLTTAERKRILLSHIHGVDIDTQAVEVTKLSLLLKVLEGETRQSLDNQLRLFHERALPDLASNIKCGNSLIGPDFYEGKQMNLFDEEEALRINAFDWKVEFKDILAAGGFDAVIGNPPWGADIDKVTAYIETRYPDSTKGYRDSFKLFIDRARQLVQANGTLSLIVPSAFMLQPRYKDVRALLRQLRIRTLWNIGDKVFGPKVVAPACIFVVEKTSPGLEHEVQTLDTARWPDNATRSQMVKEPQYGRVLQTNFEKTSEEAFAMYHREYGPKEVALSTILECKDCGIKHQRVGCGMEEKGRSDLASRLYYEAPKQDSNDHPYLIGADLAASRYYIDCSKRRFFRASYPNILRENEIVYFNEGVFNLPRKIVWRQTSDRVRATILGPHWFANTLQAGVLLDDRYDLRYVLGLLNSKFFQFAYIESVKETGRVFPQVKLAKVRALPFRTIDFSDKSDKEKHHRMVELVQSMLDLHDRLAKAKTDHEKTALERQIAATDGQIDRLVYELYGLTEEEIKIVEEGTE